MTEKKGIPWKRILIGKWSWKRPFYTVGFCYLALAAFAYFKADSLIFQPPGTPYPEKREGFVTIPDGESKVAGYYRPPEAGMPTILWSHGNAENLASLVFTMNGLHHMGFGVMAYDYPGYGESSGKPTEKGSNQSARAAYQYLLDQKTKPEQIVLIGQSVGSGPTCQLASEVKHGGVILISPFISAYRVVTKIPLFPGDRFPNLSRISDFKTPLLIIHGQDDKVIPHDHGKRLYEKSQSEPKTFISVAEAGHNNLFQVESVVLTETIRQFAEQFRIEIM